MAGIKRRPLVKHKPAALKLRRRPRYLEGARRWTYTLQRCEFTGVKFTREVCIRFEHKNPDKKSGTSAAIGGKMCRNLCKHFSHSGEGNSIYCVGRKG